MRVRPTGCLRIDWTVQRRRRTKAAPKNIFGSVPQTTQKSKPTNQTSTKSPRSRTHIAPPPSVPGAKTRVATSPESTSQNAVKEAVASTPVVEEQPVVEDTTSEATEEEILQDQLLGSVTRKEIGLKKSEQTSEKIPDDVTDGKSLKARQIIQDSMLKASIAVEEAKTLKRTQQKPKTTKETPKKPQRKFRNKTSSYQPANRARRLDRSRHMEYKYEMRGLLTEIGIDEEHRSNLLATIWARGERQTTKEAKEFLEEKLSEGIIDDDQMSSLEKIVDGYTVRR